MKVLDIAISDILNFLDGGRIYLWGNGASLKKNELYLEKYNILPMVKRIIDRNKSGEKTIGSKTIPIIKPDECIKQLDEKDIIIITTKNYNEILNEVEKNVEYKNRYVCVYSKTILRELEKERDLIEVPTSLHTTTKQIIPKVIHYCWFGDNSIPSDYKKWMESWRKYCPDYEIVEWNESNYDIHKNRYIEQAYEAKKWAFVSDYARLDIIYNYGGIYLDTDVEIVKNIDDLLYNEGFCGYEQKDYVAFGLGFGAKKHNSLIKEIMSVYERMSFINSDGTYNMTTCPTIQTDVLEKHGMKRNGEYQVIDGFAIFPEKVLCGKNIFTREVIKDLTNTYMIHHFAASWLESSV